MRSSLGQVTRLASSKRTGNFSYLSVTLQGRRKSTDTATGIAVGGVSKVVAENRLANTPVSVKKGIASPCLCQELLTLVCNASRSSCLHIHMPALLAILGAPLHDMRLPVLDILAEGSISVCPLCFETTLTLSIATEQQHPFSWSLHACVWHTF